MGWILGFFFRFEELAIDFFRAFLAGGIILNVIKEELPKERESRTLPLLLGAALYSGILFLAEWEKET